MNRIMLREEIAREEQRRGHMVKAWRERERWMKSDGVRRRTLYGSLVSLNSWPASDEPHIEHTNAKVGPLR